MHPAARWSLRLAAAAVATVLVSLLTYGLALVLYTMQALVLDSYRTTTFIGVNAPKTLALVAVAMVVLLAFPLAILDGVSSLRFHRLERELRQLRPQDAITPYEGPEGRGHRFEGPQGGLLLLRPPGGFGRPRVVALPSAPAPEAPEPHAAEAPGVPTG